MKPAHYTIYYVVYPPNYKPGDGYVKRKNLKAALHKARGWGEGSWVIRWVECKHNPQRKVGFLSWYSSTGPAYMLKDGVLTKRPYRKIARGVQ